MSWLHRIRAALRNLFFRKAIEDDLADELAAYVELAADEGLRRGESDRVARRRALIALGGVTAVAESVRGARAGSGLERFWQDVRYAWRGLRRSPAYTATAVVTLAVGIGANTAVFSVADAAMFKPLPYKDPDQLVDIAYVFNRGAREETRQFGYGWQQLDRWREETHVFSSIATFMSADPVTIAEAPAAGVTRIRSISPDLTSVLGVGPCLGRAFSTADVDSNGKVVILAEHFWRSAFAGDRTILGRTLTIDGQPHAVVGVMPLTLLWRVGGPGVVGWVPLDEVAERGKRRSFPASIARLRPGWNLERAERELSLTADEQQAAVPPDKRWGVELVPLDFRDHSGWTGRALGIMLGAVGFVLLIACANVANLLLARVLLRRRELAVRSALGATRGRLMRQLVTEGLLLALLGGVGAVMLADWILAVLPVLVPPDLQLFAANPLALDLRTLGFCGAVVIATALLSSLVPAVRASRADVIGAMEGSARVAGPTRIGRRIRFALQAAQVAMTLVLLAGAGLFAASFIQMANTEAGYDVEGLAAVNLLLPTGRYPSTVNQSAFFDELLARVRRIPGVRAAYGEPPPSGGGGRFIAFGNETSAEQPFASATARTGSLAILRVGSDYFSTVGIPLLAGRALGDDDEAGAPVGVIDERAAVLHWPGQSPLGKQFRYSPWVPWITVVGVAGHVKTRDFASAATVGGSIQAYLPIRRSGEGSPYRTLLLRSDDDVEPAVGVVQEILQAMDRSLRPERIMRVEDMYDDAFVEPRFVLVLISLFAAVALVPASAGLYGVLTYSVGQRAREIGVRMALGADVRQVRRLILNDALWPVVAGVFIGLGAAYWLTQYLSSLLYEVAPHDPITFTVVIILIGTISALAALGPVRRATLIDPVATLHPE